MSVCTQVCVFVHIWLCLWLGLLWCAHTSLKNCALECVRIVGRVCICAPPLYVCMSEHISARLCVCVCARVCMHGPCVCVFSEPLPTITVSVHYSLWPAKIIINGEQRWTEGNERLVGGATEACLVLLDKWHNISPFVTNSSLIILYFISFIGM